MSRPIQKGAEIELNFIPSKIGTGFEKGIPPFIAIAAKKAISNVNKKRIILF
jgi:hypothetical protein